MIIIPSVLVRVLDDVYECAFLLGEKLNNTWIVESLAFVRATVSKVFKCIQPLKDNVIGVIHNHNEEVSTADVIKSRIWPVYVVKTRNVLKGFEHGVPTEVVLI